MILQAISLSIYTTFIFTFLKRYARFGVRIPINNSGKDETLPYLEDNINIKSIPPTATHPYTKAYDIAHAIKISSKYIPWKNVCRHQAYQAKLLCNFYKVPYKIFIGFKKDKETNEIQAHAWTVADGKIITGFCNPEEYTVQSIYKNKWQ